MILTGPEIEKQVKAKKIIIEPYDHNLLNPNSYDFRLGKTLLVYKNHLLDCKKKNDTEKITIPEEGMILRPDRLYLGHTVETMGSNHYVPILRGKSSTGRIGLFVHITADLIDIGAIFKYTLMFHAVQPVRIYAGMKIGQITFWRTQGDIVLYEGKYQNSVGPRSSQVYKDF